MARVAARLQDSGKGWICFLARWRQRRRPRQKRATPEESHGHDGGGSAVTPRMAFQNALSSSAMAAPLVAPVVARRRRRGQGFTVHAFPGHDVKPPRLESGTAQNGRASLLGEEPSVAVSSHPLAHSRWRCSHSYKYKAVGHLGRRRTGSVGSVQIVGVYNSILKY